MIRIIWQRGDAGSIPTSVVGMVSESLESKILRVERCGCGAERVIWEGDLSDPWKHHFDYEHEQ